MKDGHGCNLQIFITFKWLEVLLVILHFLSSAFNTTTSLFIIFCIFSAIVSNLQFIWFKKLLNRYERAIIQSVFMNVFTFSNFSSHCDNENGKEFVRLQNNLCFIVLSLGMQHINVNKSKQLDRTNHASELPTLNIRRTWQGTATCFH